MGCSWETSSIHCPLNPNYLVNAPRFNLIIKIFYYYYPNHLQTAIVYEDRKVWIFHGWKECQYSTSLFRWESKPSISKSAAEKRSVSCLENQQLFQSCLTNSYLGLSRVSLDFIIQSFHFLLNFFSRSFFIFLIYLILPFWVNTYIQPQSHNLL